MVSTEDDIRYINSMTNEELLERWRNAPVGCTYFIGTPGMHARIRLAEFQKTDPKGFTEASKRIEWTRDD